MGDDRAPADILVTTPNIHIRGMDRNSVMIDGTKPGSPECSPAEGDQTFGAPQEGAYQGNNGVVVYKASGVTPAELLHLQLPRLQRRRRLGLVRRRRCDRQTGNRLLAGRIPELYLDLLGRGRKALRRVRHLRLQHHRTRLLRAHLRQQHVRLGLLHRRVPGLQRHHRRRHRRRQRPRLLGLELRRTRGDRELALQEQRGGRRHAEPEQRRRAIPAGRPLPGRQGQPEPAPRRPAQGHLLGDDPQPRDRKQQRGHTHEWQRARVWWAPA